MAEVKGSWGDSQKGGVFIQRALRANPQYALTVEKDASVSITMTIPSAVQGVGLGLFLLEGVGGNPVMIAPVVVAETSFEYDVTSVTLAADVKAKKSYVLIPCWTSDSDKLTGDFTIKANGGAKLAALNSLSAKEVKGKWDEKTSGGDKDSKKFEKNESFFFSLKKKDTVQISLRRDEGRNIRVGFYVFDADAVKKAVEFSSKAIAIESPFEDLQEVHATKELDAGLYVIIPCTSDAGDTGKFTVSIWASALESFFSPTAKTSSKLSVSSDSGGSSRSSSRRNSTAGHTSAHSNSGHSSHSRSSSDVDSERAVALLSALELKKVKATSKKLKKDLEELKQKYDEEKKKWEAEHVEAQKNKERVERLEREKSKAMDEAAFLRKQHGGRMEELMLAVERLTIEVEKYRKKENEVEDNMDWTLPLTSAPKSGKVVDIHGEWRGKSAGGCLNHLSWRHNPQILLNVARNSDVTVTIYQPRKADKAEMHEISFYIFRTYTKDMKRLVLPYSIDHIVAEGNFSQEKNSKVSVTVPLQGSEFPYVIVPATYLPNDEGRWVVQMQSQHEVTATLSTEAHTWPMVQGAWKGATAGGCPNFKSFVNNPMYSLTVNNYGQIRFFLLQEEKPHEVFDTMSIYLLRADGESNKKISVFKKSMEVSHVDFSKPTEVVLTVDDVQPGRYIVVPCTFSPAQEAAFSLYVLTSISVSPLTPLVDAFFLEAKGSWSGETAGGTVMNKATWSKNPQFALTVPKNMVVTVSLSQDRPSGSLYGIGLIVTNEGAKATEATTANVTFKGDLRKESTLIEDIALVGRSVPYTIIPSTYNPGEEAAFTLRVTSTDPAFETSASLKPF